MPFSFAQATPESVGIPSDAILRYADALEDLALSLHSLTSSAAARSSSTGSTAP